MSPIPFARVTVPAAVALFFAVALVAPVLRARARGARHVVVHEGPVQRVVGTAMGLALASVGAWAALFATLGPEAIGVRPVPAPLAAVGGALALAGLGVVAVAQIQMGASWRIGIDDRPTSLVARGLFRVVRNPIYAGVLAALAGVVLATPSAFTIALAIEAAILVAIQTRLEEAHLDSTHGEAYRAYAREVGRFVPFVGRLRA